MLDTPIKTKPSNMSNNRRSDSTTYSHESFGRIRVARCSGDVQIFGSEIRTSSFMSISISECEVTQDLGRNWYYSHNVIVEAWLTPVQYAEMISSPNTEGIPCTIRSRHDTGVIKPKNIDSMTTYAISQVEEKATDAKDRLGRLVAKIETIFTKKGTLKKGDKEEALGLIKRLVQDMGVNFEFQEKCVAENIERSVMEAKAEINHHITHAIAKLGIDTLRNPEAIKLVLGGNKQLENHSKE